METPFWLTDYRILYVNDLYLQFYPNKDMTRIEQLNSIARFSWYSLIIFIILGQNKKWIYLPILILLLTIALFYLDKNDQRKKSEQNAIDQATNRQDMLIKKKKCRKPTKNNPFMNSSLNDVLTSGTIDDQEPPCDITDPKIKEQVKQNFEEDLYQNVGDLFGKKHSDRQFYTVNHEFDTLKYANFLFKKKDTCKKDGTGCLKYNDLRYHKN